MAERHTGVASSEPHREIAARDTERSAIDRNVPGIVFYVAIEPSGEFRFQSMSDDGLATMGLSREQVVGVLVRDVIPPPSRDLVLKNYREATRSGQTVRWKEVTEYPAGRKVGEVAVTPVYDADGVATHLVGVVHDITERERREVALHQREERLAFLLRLNDALRPLSDPAAIQEISAQLLADHLNVARAGYSELDRHGYITRHEYTRSGVPRTGSLDGISVGAELREALLRGETLVLTDVDTDPRLTDDDRATLRSRQIAAMVAVTLFKNGRMVASFGANHDGPRAWGGTEIALVRDVAERTWDAVERTRAQALLSEQQEHLRLALDASAGGTWTWVAATNRVEWDQRFRSLYGFTQDEPANPDAWPTRVHDEDRARVLATRDEILTSTTTDSWENTFRIVRPDGTVGWVQSRGRALRDDCGRIIRLSGLDLDFSRHHQVEEARQAQRDEDHNRELRLLLETASQGVVSLDARGTILMANRALETMFGWPPGALSGQSIEQLVPGWFRDRPSGGGLDTLGWRRDGSTFPIEVSVNQVPTSDGGRAIAFVTDITERQERTAVLEHRTAQLSRLASDLTLAEHHAREEIAKTLHDGLQQMLVAAALNLDLRIARDRGEGAKSDDLLIQAKGQLNEAIASARSLSFELLPPALHSSGLPAALNWLANWSRSKYKLNVDVQADPLATSDRKDVRTLLFESVRELLFNVVKHAQVDRVGVDLRIVPDDLLCITVEDRGIGFDPPSVVERSKARLTGWGLFSISERLMLLGGRFEIDSAPGKGARFRLVAPRGAAQES
jgi:PAS domain S-box-containing protein